MFWKYAANMQSNFIEVTLRQGCSPVNFLHVFRTPFLKNTFVGMLLFVSCQFIGLPTEWHSSFMTLNDNNSLLAKLVWLLDVSRSAYDSIFFISNRSVTLRTSFFPISININHSCHWPLILSAIISQKYYITDYKILFLFFIIAWL